MNPVSHLAAVAAGLYLGLGAYALYIKPRERLNQVFALLCATFALWNVTLMFIVTAPDVASVWPWYRVSAVSWVFAPVILLHFFLLLTGVGKGRTWIFVIPYALAVVFFVRSLTGTVFASDFAWTPYGWDEVIRLDGWCAAYLLYYSTSVIVGLWVVYRWGAASRVPREKRQAHIILLWAVPTLVLVSVSNVLLRLLDVHLTPGLAPVLLPIWGVGILYAIVKHDLMALEPSTAADEILATLADALLLVGMDGCVLSCNQSATQLFVLEEGELRGKPVAELFPEEVLFHAGRLEKRLADGPLRNVQLEYKTSERSIPISLSASLVSDELGHAIGVVIILRDVSELKRLEENLLHSAKMEALGQLAGGVAHDFNNLLAVMLTEAQMIRMDKPELADSAGAIEKAARRAAELTTDLLGFARRGQKQSVRVDLHETIHDTVRLLRRTLPKKISISLEFLADRAVVVGDPTQLQQVLINLAINARDAMPDGGTITFKTINLELGEESGVARKHVEVRVLDTGAGIEPRHIPHIFEPFFTTKGAGRGTGMGLAMVYGVVTGHGGRIAAESRISQGTTFRLYLPLDDSGLRADSTGKHVHVPQGEGRILVVDDETMILTAARSALSRLGYQVDTANGGEEAVRCYGANQEQVDLVLLDVVMPGVDGRECFQQLRRINPEVKALLMSGHAPKSDVDQLLSEGAVGLLQKPFTIEGLAAAVRGALDPTDRADRQA